MRRLIAPLLALALLVAATAADTALTGLNDRKCLKFYFGNGTARDSSNSGIVAYREGLTDTTGKYKLATTYLEATQGSDTFGVWCWEADTPWVYQFVDTVGPDTVLSYPRFFFMGDLELPDSAAGSSADFNDKVIPSSALEDSIIDSARLIKAGIVGTNALADLAVNANKLAAGAVNTTSKLSGTVVNEAHLNFNSFTEGYSFTDTILFADSVTVDSMAIFKKGINVTVADGTTPMTITSTTKVTNLNVDEVDGLSLIKGFATWTNDANYDTVLVSGVDATDVCVGQGDDITSSKIIIGCDCRVDSLILRINNSFGATGVTYGYIVATD